MSPLKNLLSPSLFLGDPSYDSSDRTMASVGYEFQHKLNSNWQVRQNARYLWLDWDYNSLYITRPRPLHPAVALRGSSEHRRTRAPSPSTRRSRRIPDRRAGHTVLFFGLDYRRYNENDFTQFGLAPSINLLFPVYNQFVSATPWYLSQVNGNVSQTGLYAQIR